MRKILLLFLALLTLILISGHNISKANQSLVTFQIQDSVYICNSSGAYAYHIRINCSGLQRCTHGIIKVSKKDAINIYRRSACKICSRQ